MEATEFIHHFGQSLRPFDKFSLVERLPELLRQVGEVAFPDKTISAIETAISKVCEIGLRHRIPLFLLAPVRPVAFLNPL
jgi:hypothetical protein